MSNVSLTYMTMIYLTKAWFEIVEIRIYDLDEVTGGNNEYTDKASTMVMQLFRRTWLSRYPRPHKFMCENGSEIKRDFTPLLK